jgi:hypothetical protein
MLHGKMPSVAAPLVEFYTCKTLIASNSPSPKLTCNFKITMDLRSVSLLLLFLCAFHHCCLGQSQGQGQNKSPTKNTALTCTRSRLQVMFTMSNMWWPSTLSQSNVVRKIIIMGNKHLQWRIHCGCVVRHHVPDLEEVGLSPTGSSTGFANGPLNYCG